MHGHASNLSEWGSARCKVLGGTAYFAQPATMLLVLLRGLGQGWLRLRMTSHAVPQAVASLVFASLVPCVVGTS